ncbi:hypothetical protein Q5752_004134 [Cryptotrichosporon argae]
MADSKGLLGPWTMVDMEIIKQIYRDILRSSTGSDTDLYAGMDFDDTLCVDSLTAMPGVEAGTAMSGIPDFMNAVSSFTRFEVITARSVREVGNMCATLHKAGLLKFIQAITACNGYTAKVEELQSYMELEPFRFSSFGTANSRGEPPFFGFSKKLDQLEGRDKDELSTTVAFPKSTVINGSAGCVIVDSSGTPQETSILHPDSTSNETCSANKTHCDFATRWQTGGVRHNDGTVRTCPLDVYVDNSPSEVRRAASCTQTMTVMFDAKGKSMSECPKGVVYVRNAKDLKTLFKVLHTVKKEVRGQGGGSEAEA